jgi:hypothetical protein
MKTGLTRLFKIGKGGGLGLLLALALIACIVIPAMPVMAAPIPPFTADGHAMICSASLPIGTVIIPKINGVQYGTGSVTAVDGFYHVVVVGDDPGVPGKQGGVDGDVVDFFIMGKLAGQAVFESLGIQHNLDLNVTLLDLTVTSVGCCPITVDTLGTVPAGGTLTFLDIPCGTDILLTAENSSCCTFNGWDIDGSPVLDNPYHLIMHDFHTVTANCTHNEYTLTVNYVGNGTVTKNPDQATYACGTEVTLTANADPGWSFSAWSGDLTGSANSANITMDGNKTVTATFIEGDVFTLAVNTSGNGTVTKNPDQATYPAGTEVTLTANADPGWTFSAWSGNLTGSTNPATITMDGNKTVTATFTQYQYTLTVNISPVGGGTVAKNPDQATYTYGTNVALTANANPGWTFSAWSGNLTGNANPATIIMDGNKMVTATFVEGEVFTLTVNTSGNGTVNKTPDQATYTPGTEVTLTANADPGWSFSAWSGNLTGSTNPATIIIDGNKTVTATFTQDQYTLTVNGIGGGSVAKNPNQPTYTYGTVVTLTANASPGWSFSVWSGNLTGSTNPATITMNGDKTVTATFVEGEVFTLTVNYVGNGTVAKNPEQATYAPGTEVTLTANADPGWTFSAWSGNLTGSTNPNTITMNGNKTVIATFTQNQYTLTVNISPVGGGSVAKNPNQATYTYGTVVTLTPNANPGWNFSAWSGDLTGSANPATITMNGNKTVTATFVPESLSYTLTVKISGQGLVTAPGTGTFQYPQGTVVPLTAIPKANCDFLAWTGNTSTVTNPNAANTFITMNGNYEIIASFTVWTVSLEADWNTFSTPITLDGASDTWGELITLGGLSTQAALSYHGGEFSVVTANYTIQPCDAIFVKMASAGSVPIIPSMAVTSPPSLNVVRGWNLIGSAFINGDGLRSVYESLISLYYAGVPWGYTQVISPAYNQPWWVYARDGVVKPNMLMGKGYWVSMENADQYEGQTMTPWFDP